MKEEEPAEGKKSEDDGIGKENLAILEKIKKNQRQDYLNVRAFQGEAGPRAWWVLPGRLGVVVAPLARSRPFRRAGARPVSAPACVPRSRVRDVCFLFLAGRGVWLGAGH